MEKSLFVAILSPLYAVILTRSTCDSSIWHNIICCSSKPQHIRDYMLQSPWTATYSPYIFFLVFSFYTNSPLNINNYIDNNYYTNNHSIFPQSSPIIIQIKHHLKYIYIYIYFFISLSLLLKLINMLWAKISLSIVNLKRQRE